MRNFDFYQRCFTFLICLQFIRTMQVAQSRHDREVQCEKSRIDHNVTLASGHHAGVFLKANKSIVTMKRCLQQCCQMKGCDVAFFSNGACYSVKCSSIDTCAPTMNSDKRMMVAISYVAKPKVTSKQVSVDKGVEREVTDNLIAEVTRESPFLVDDDNLVDQSPVPSKHHSAWRETKDAILAVICGCVAVAAGVVGVIMMTRRLVEEDEHFPFNGNGCREPLLDKNSTFSKENLLPTISECEDENLTGALDDCEHFRTEDENSPKAFDDDRSRSVDIETCTDSLTQTTDLSAKLTTIREEGK
ncbi:uncharacterized protein [Clytia hemisphaerica]